MYITNPHIAKMKDIVSKSLVGLTVTSTARHVARSAHPRRQQPQSLDLPGIAEYLYISSCMPSYYCVHVILSEYDTVWARFCVKNDVCTRVNHHMECKSPPCRSSVDNCTCTPLCWSSSMRWTLGRCNCNDTLLNVWRSVRYIVV